MAVVTYIGVQRVIENKKTIDLIIYEEILEKTFISPFIARVSLRV